MKLILYFAHLSSERLKCMSVKRSLISNCLIVTTFLIDGRGLRHKPFKDHKEYFGK